MWGKIFIIITNLSSIITLYYGHKYKEYTISICVFVTSILSLIFHAFTEYPNISSDNLSFLRLLDFYYSYKSIIVVTTNFLTDYTVWNYNYDLIMTPIVLTMATHLTEKKLFLSTIVPVTLGIILPILYFKRNSIIKPRLDDNRLWICMLLIITNIIVYSLEKQINYYILHSIHHLICFSVPGLLIEYKNNNKNLLNNNNVFVEKIIQKIPSMQTLNKISSLTNISNIASINPMTNIQNTSNPPNDFSNYTNLEDNHEEHLEMV